MSDTLMLDPTTGTGETFDVIFDEVLALEDEKYALDPTGGQPSKF